MVIHSPNVNEERRAGGASPLWQAGAAAGAEIGTCLPWERGAGPRAAVKRQSKSNGFGETDAGTVVSVWSPGVVKCDFSPKYPMAR